jgi:hypothetical protein
MERPNSQSDSSYRLASFFSIILSPPFIALGTVLVFAFFSPIGSGLLTPWQSLLLGLIFVIIGPVLPLSILVALGRLTFDVENRRDRPLLYLAAILVYLVGAMIAWVFQNHSLAVLAMAYVAVTSAIAIVSLRWKASAHTAGVAGPITGLIWVYGILLTPLLLLAVLVAWARWIQKLHSITQLASGILIAMLITAGVYYALW